MRHTPPPPIDITTIVPAFAALARQTVRLHPRVGECAVDENKLGGLFLWPVDEPWPYDEESGYPFVPVLQLRLEDVPEIGFPKGKDLFQLFWCFNEQVICKVFWRKRSDIKNYLKELPEEVSIEIEEDEGMYPTPCILHPERVTEYPHLFDIMDHYPELDEAIEFSEELAAIVERFPEQEFEDTSDVYQSLLSTADGTKVGGYPSWIQEPDVPDEMEYLLTISSIEFDEGTCIRWLAQEDQDQCDDSVISAANLTLGDLGNVNVFINRQHPDYPVIGIFQCD